MTEYEKYYSQIKNNWDLIAKPLDSLGKLENLISQIGAIQKKVFPCVKKSVALILCSDNGIVEEGVSQSKQSVTKICARNIAAKKTTVGIIAKSSHTKIQVVDLGINSSQKIKNVLDKKIRKGTRNFAKESAMTFEEMQSAIKIGEELVKECKKKNYNIICVGEMGIGNTTSSAAIASSILKCDVKKIVGRGAGLSDEGLNKKILVIQNAIKKYNLYEKNSLEILQTVGGFDIAGMVGIFLGAKKFEVPVVLDGVVSFAAALVAQTLDGEITKYLIPSHKSREPLVNEIIKKLNLSPILDADMALGEGSGAVLMMNIIKVALEVYKKSVPFKKSGVEQYKRYD